MDGKQAPLLCDEKEKQTYGMEKILHILHSCLRMAVDPYVGTIFKHMGFVYIFHLRKQYDIVVRILEDRHFEILQKHLSVAAAGGS